MGCVGRVRSVGIAAVLFAVACSTTPDGRRGDGVTHTLRAGENLYRLARYYDVPVDVIVRANRIGDVTELRTGQEIWIPGADREPPDGALVQPEGQTSPDGRVRPAEYAGVGLAWPVRGRLSSRFGWRHGRRHDGIDIPAKRGTPVRAAQAGRVIHSGGGLGDYGRVVIIKHAGRYSTVYAHNDKLSVRKGQFIEKGEVVARVGTSGNASGPHVHFEVRRDRQPLDPLLFLP